MQIFAGVPWKVGVKWQWEIENVDFQYGRWIFKTLGSKAIIII